MIFTLSWEKVCQDDNLSLLVFYCTASGVVCKGLF